MRVSSTDSVITWVTNSLERGGPFAKELLQIWRPGPVASLFAEEGSVPTVPQLGFDDVGRGLGVEKSRQVAVSELAGLVGSDRHLIVEDDLGRRGDPGLGPEVLLVGDRVARVFRLGSSEDVVRAVDGLLRGASGYPTNAFIVEDGGMGLPDTGSSPIELTSSRVQELATGVVAVVVSVFDSETYLMVPHARVLS